ncbi:MAG: hypothetical protein ACW99G_19600 [Candidatus Thorarchaeota archaeon]|jgi:hypothetical protein
MKENLCIGGVIGLLIYMVSCVPGDPIDEQANYAIAHPEYPELLEAVESVVENEYISAKENMYLNIIFKIHHRNAGVRETKAKIQEAKNNTVGWEVFDGEDE